MLKARNHSWLAIAAALTLAGGLAACSEREQEAAESDAAAAGDALQEEAVQVGEAIEAGAREVGQEIDEATDNLQREAREQRAETEADAARDNQPGDPPR